MIVYVAGKYTSDDYSERDAYVEEAVEVAKKILKLGHIPIIPHKQTHTWEEDDRFFHWSADDWLNNYCFPVLERCDALVVSCGLGYSYGVEREIDYAESLGIPIYKSFDEFYQTIMENTNVF